MMRWGACDPCTKVTRDRSSGNLCERERRQRSFLVWNSFRYPRFQIFGRSKAHDRRCSKRALSLREFRSFPASAHL